MSKKVILGTSILLSVILTGCKSFEQIPFLNPKSIKKPQKVAKKVQKKEKTVKVSPDTILDSILDGMSNSNYSSFSRRFNETFKKKLTKDKFSELYKGISGHLGKYKSRTYLGSLKKGPFTVYIWKSRFSKLKDTEMVIYLTLGKPDKKIEVFDFRISNS